MDDRTLLRIVLIISIASLAATSAVLIEMRGGSGTAAQPPANYPGYNSPAHCGDIPVDCDQDISYCEGCARKCGDDESCFSSCKRCIGECSEGDTQCYEICEECIRPCNGDEDCYDSCVAYRPRYSYRSNLVYYYMGTFNEVVQACDNDSVCIQRCVDNLSSKGMHANEGTITCLSRPESTG